MESTIIARYRLTEYRMAESLRVHSKLAPGKITKAWIFLCRLVAFAAIGYSLCHVQLEHWTAWLIIPSAVFVLVMFASLNYLLHSDRANLTIARYLIARTPEGSKDIEWLFSDDLIEQRTSISSTSFLWELVTKVVEVPGGFLIYRGKFAFDWIPGDAFESHIDARLFAQMAESHAKEFVIHGECSTAAAHLVEGRYDG